MAITKLIREHKVKVTKSRLPMSATEENCPRQLPCWLRSWCVRTLHRLFRDPTLRQSVFFHWTQVFLQLNSAANSICYCFRNRHFRNAMLELLKIKTTWRCWNPPPPPDNYKVDATLQLVAVKARPDNNFCKLHTDTIPVQEKWKGPRQLWSGCRVYIQ